MEKDTLELAQQILTMPNQVICTFYQDKKVCTVGIDIDRNEQIGVCFEKGYVIVRTQTETKFVCKGKAFISLWK